MDPRVPELVSAIANDDFDGVANLLAQGLPADAMDGQGHPVIISARSGRMLAFLKARGARWPQKLRNGETPLHAAVVFASQAVIDDLVKAGSSLFATDYLERTVLERAYTSRPAIAASLLERTGAAPSINLARKLLPAVLRHGHVAVAQRMLTPELIGALNASEGQMLFTWAVARGEAEIAGRLPKFALADGALIGPATMDDEAQLSRLLEAGAKVDGRHPTGETALHAAARRGGVGCVEMLLAAGATANATDHYGRTPLHALASANQPVDSTAVGRIVSLLVAAGADPRAVDASGESIAVCARREGRFDVLAALFAATQDRSLWPWIDATAEGISECALASFGSLSVTWRPHHPSKPLLLASNQRYDEWLQDCTVADALGPSRERFVAAGAGWLLGFLARRGDSAAQPRWSEVEAEYLRVHGSAPAVIRPLSV